MKRGPAPPSTASWGPADRRHRAPSLARPAVARTGFRTGFLSGASSRRIYTRGPPAETRRKLLLAWPRLQQMQPWCQQNTAAPVSYTQEPPASGHVAACRFRRGAVMSCDVHAHTPAKKSSTNFPTVPISSTQMIYKLSWAWAWVIMNATAQVIRRSRSMHFPRVWERARSGVRNATTCR